MCRSDNNRFRDIQHALSGKTIFDKLAGAFELLADFKTICATVSNFSYTENMELKVLAHDMAVATLLGPNPWKSIQLYGSNKLKIQP